MKIGIITHWKVPNYGSFLQAYSLRNYLQREYKSAEVKVINYIKPIHIKMYYNLEVHENFKYWLINPGFYKDLVQRFRRKNYIERMRKFLEYYEEIPHTKQFDEKSIRKEKFDYVIFGSDILWDYSIPFFGHDPISFGIGVNTNHKISYAASFGTVKENENHPSYVREGLNDFEYISVRDTNSSKIVYNITEKNAKVVIDPSLLWDFGSDKKIDFSRKKPDYIMIYGCEFTNSQVEYIKFIAKEKRLRIISFGNTKDEINWCDEYFWDDEITPFEWCAYIRDAYAVVTCTFHGLMFSLMYNKTILFNATPFMKDKATSFLDYLGLKELLIENQDFNKQLNWSWDYTDINSRISMFREESARWIKSVIK